jgi:hypothetical protein
MHAQLSYPDIQLLWAGKKPELHPLLAVVDLAVAVSNSQSNCTMDDVEFVLEHLLQLKAGRMLFVRGHDLLFKTRRSQFRLV